MRYEDTVELTHTGFVERHVWLGCVIRKIVGEESFKNIEVPFALDPFGISSHDGFRRI